MSFMTIVVMFPATPKPDPASMNYTAVVLGGVLVLALAYYYAPVYGGVYWFKGPQSTLEKGGTSRNSDSVELTCGEQTLSAGTAEKVKDNNHAEVKVVSEA